MKNSVINQVEKVLREQTSCWDSVKITRDESCDWVTFNITDNNSFITTPIIDKILKVHDAFEIATLSLGINCCLVAKRGEYGEIYPAIQLNIRKG